MFSRLYFIVGLLSLVGFSYAQYRGVSPFDTYASSPGSGYGSGSGGRYGSSHTYHK